MRPARRCITRQGGFWAAASLVRVIPRRFARKAGRRGVRCLYPCLLRPARHLGPSCSTRTSSASSRSSGLGACTASRTARSGRSRSSPAVFLAVAILMAVLLPSQRSPGAGAVLVLHRGVRGRVPPRLRGRQRLGRADAADPRADAVRASDRLVPLAVAAGIVLGSLDHTSRGSTHLGRVVLRRRRRLARASARRSCSGLRASAGRGSRDWPLYVARAAAQFVARRTAAPPGASGSRSACVRGVQLRTMVWVYAIDAGLAPVGLAVAFATQSVALRRRARAAAGRAALRLRARAPGAHRPRARATRRLPRDGVPARRRGRGRRRLHGRAQPRRRGADAAVADHLGLSARERRDAEFAALLHDVGKVRVPNEIINKPGPLTNEERAIIEQHTIEGERLLHRVGGLLGEIGRVVRSCHEHWDGERLSRRPRGRADSAAGADRRVLRRLQRDDERPLLPQGACPSTRRLPSSAADAGTQFDPQVVDALIESLAVA